MTEEERLKGERALGYKGLDSSTDTPSFTEEMIAAFTTCVCITLLCLLFYYVLELFWRIVYFFYTLV
jgi:hypothetical protein